MSSTGMDMKPWQLNEDEPRLEAVAIGDLVEVAWDDASWWPEDVDDVGGLEDLCERRTLGCVVRITDKSLFLAAEYGVGPEGDRRSLKGVTRVPCNYLLAVTPLHPQPRPTPGPTPVP